MNFHAQSELLTHLPDRTLFRKDCQNALQRAQRKRSLPGLRHLDLDRFEHINNSFGYAAADGEHLAG